MAQFPKPVEFDLRRLCLDRRRLTPPIKVGVVVAGMVEGWMQQLLDFLRALPNVSLTISTTAAGCLPTSAPWLARRLYQRSRRQFDPFAPAPQFSKDPAEAEIDLLLALGPDNFSLKTRPRYGILTLQLGERDLEPPYWGEVMEADTTSQVIVKWRETFSSPPRILRRAEIPTRRRLSFTQNARACLAAAAQIVAEIVLDAAVSGSEWPRKCQSLPDAPPSPERRYPSNLQCAVFAGREILRARREARYPNAKKQWFCAIRREPELFYSSSGRFRNQGFEEIPTPKGTQMADPFPVRYRNSDWIFSEEIPEGTDKGRISCMQVPSPGKPFSRPEVVLDIDTHLSFPCIFRHQNDYFMIPESCASQDLRLYRATNFPFGWQLESILIEDLPLTDTTPVCHNNRWYFFTTTMYPVMQTLLFQSRNLGDPLELHPESPISSSIRNTRSAGHLFWAGQQLLRPAQDCSIRYGYGITINKVVRLTPSEYSEVAVGHISPQWAPGLLGTHTLNSTTHLEVIDGCRYEHR